MSFSSCEKPKSSEIVAAENITSRRDEWRAEGSSCCGLLKILKEDVQFYSVCFFFPIFIYLWMFVNPNLYSTFVTVFVLVNFTSVFNVLVALFVTPRLIDMMRYHVASPSPKSTKSHTCIMSLIFPGSKYFGI